MLKTCSVKRLTSQSKACSIDIFSDEFNVELFHKIVGLLFQLYDA